MPDHASASRPANHLRAAQSPYLLQHAHNPVDWYPWGEEAFARARAERKPIFLSVGYATCHWCHVMERECFEDEAVAALLNAGFVSIKVDREERPDVDRLHMHFLLATTGHGGWPMSVWLTPELRPFYAGTYFPPEDLPGRTGFKTLLARITELWTREPQRVVAHAAAALAALAAGEAPGAAATVEADRWREQAVRELAQAYDPAHGGFGGAPKFPNACFLHFLLDYQAQGRDSSLRIAAQEAALGTLRRIGASGLRDHIGGGFHRYAVDAGWRLPHFEKMLNDQALLVDVLVDAWLVSGEAEFRRAAEECLDYLDTHQRDPGGAWWTAEDADSPAGDSGERREGAFYLWTADELRAALGTEDAATFARAYGIGPEGNLAELGGEEFAGRNLPYRAEPAEATPADRGPEAAAPEARLVAALARLRAVRAARRPPDCDDKVLAAWNGLAVSAFARAAFHFREPRWAEAARRAMEFVRAQLWDANARRLHRTWRRGGRGPEGFAEDYSFAIQGLLDLFACDPDGDWIGWALELQGVQDALFRDAGPGGYFASAAGDPHLLVRLKPGSDGAEPAAVSVAVRNKARLAALLHRPELRAAAQADVGSLSGTLAARPTALPQLLAALPWVDAPARQLVVVGQPGEAATEAFVAEVRGRLLPRLSLLVLHAGNREFFARQDAFYADLPAAEAGRARAYLCEDSACQLPAETPEALHRQLAALFGDD